MGPALALAEFVILPPVLQTGPARSWVKLVGVGRDFV